MSFFKKLFKKDARQKAPEQDDLSATLPTDVGELIDRQKQRYQMLANGKSPGEPLSEEYLLGIFAKWFAPHKDFYSVPGSEKSSAYFHTLNAARDEMIADQALFHEATKWTADQLADLVNHPKPAITGMMICGLVFQLGNFAVIKDAVYCVDFSTRVPHCIALYLLLIAQELPESKRTMILDAGDGVNKRPLSEALDTISVCDPSWKYQIF
ncbi:MAG: hypothetical protein IJG87_05815 [Ruminococcus sp.]|nr:hypothetical protein [Ruminococcus sp.]